MPLACNVCSTLLLRPGKKKEERLKKQAEEIKRANAPRMARGGLDPITLDLIDQRNKKEYDTDRAAQAAIDMMYRQALIWVGASLCPVLPFAGLLNITIQFFVQYYSMFESCKPPKTPWSAEKTMCECCTARILCLIAWLSVLQYCALTAHFSDRRLLHEAGARDVAHIRGADRAFAHKGHPVVRSALLRQRHGRTCPLAA